MVQRWSVLFAVVASAALFAGLAVAVALLALEGAWQSVALPRPGQVRATLLPDGQPVMVVGHDDGTVTVLSAVAPHSGEPLAWCAQSGVFVEPVGASLFDERGHYAFGPAPTGVPGFQVRVRGDQVLVGSRSTPPPRWAHARVLGVDWERDRCLRSEGALDSTALRWAALPGPFEPAEIPRQPGLYQVEGRVEVAPSEPVRLCPAGRPEGCTQGPTVAGEWLNNAGDGLDGFAGVIEGRLLVRRTSEWALVDLVTPFTTTRSRLRPLPASEESVVGTLDGVRPVDGGWAIGLAPPSGVGAASDAGCNGTRASVVRSQRSYRLGDYAIISTHALPPDSRSDRWPALSPSELAALARRRGPLMVAVCLRGDAVTTVDVLALAEG